MGVGFHGDRSRRPVKVGIGVGLGIGQRQLTPPFPQDGEGQVRFADEVRLIGFGETKNGGRIGRWAQG